MFFTNSLSGILTNLKQRFKNSSYYFDEYHIICGVSEYKKPSQCFIAYAQCVTDDHELKGFFSGPVAAIYQSKKFKTKIEAFAHLEKEIKNASKKTQGNVFL